MAHYIKAKYKVKLTGVGTHSLKDYILVQRDDNLFRFVKENEWDKWYDPELPDEKFSGWLNKMIDPYSSWDDEAQFLLQQALEGTLKPFYSINDGQEKKTEEFCSCSIQQLMMSGCICGGK